MEEPCTAIRDGAGAASGANLLHDGMKTHYSSIIKDILIQTLAPRVVAEVLWPSRQPSGR